jgi:hypothetical protein
MISLDPSRADSIQSELEGFNSPLRRWSRHTPARTSSTPSFERSQYFNRRTLHLPKVGTVTM